MQKIRPHYYDRFACIAGKCPDTCCAGWQIMIDEDSLKEYAQVPGVFGKRLRNSIDWMEECFEQIDGRCSFLNDQDLCDIYRELGEERLCYTCQNYPRHVEEFEGRREYSLSLSCPVAAELILFGEEKVRFLLEETEEEEEFEDFDFLLFTKLEDAREWMVKMLQASDWRVEEKMQALLFLANEMQSCVDGAHYFELDERIRDCKTRKWIAKGDPRERFRFMKDTVDVFGKLEVLRNEWMKAIENVKQFYQNGEETYVGIRRRFEEEYISKQKETWEKLQGRLLLSWIYTYFCGAVYDDEIYAKAMLAVFSALWIEELQMALWLENGQDLSRMDILKTAWKYAREIEHSDKNLLTLDEIFSTDERFALKNVVKAL